MRVDSHHNGSHRIMRRSTVSAHICQSCSTRRCSSTCIICCRELDVVAGERRRLAAQPALCMMPAFQTQQPNGVLQLRAAAQQYCRIFSSSRQLDIHSAVSSRPGDREGGLLDCARQPPQCRQLLARDPSASCRLAGCCVQQRPCRRPRPSCRRVQVSRTTAPVPNDYHGMPVALSSCFPFLRCAAAAARFGLHQPPNEGAPRACHQDEKGHNCSEPLFRVKSPASQPASQPASLLRISRPAEMVSPCETPTNASVLLVRYGAALKSTLSVPACQAPQQPGARALLARTSTTCTRALRR